MGRRRLISILGLLIALLTAGSASADVTVSLKDGELLLEDSPGSSVSLTYTGIFSGRCPEGSKVEEGELVCGMIEMYGPGVLINQVPGEYLEKEPACSHGNREDYEGAPYTMYCTYGHAAMVLGDGDDSTGVGTSSRFSPSTITGGTGDDDICCGTIMDGGPGNDRVSSGSAGKTFGGTGDDIMITSTTNLAKDRVYGGDGDDVFRAGVNKFVDGSTAWLFGGDGADVIRGMGGVDWIYGGTGPDKLYGGFLGDHLFGGGGKDQLFGEKQGDVLHGGAQADSCNGGVSYDLAGTSCEQNIGIEEFLKVP